MVDSLGAIVSQPFLVATATLFGKLTIRPGFESPTYGPVMD
ncbi:MAG TPA: hypothetical protein VGK58_24675 [Lacipirellulaceae bacterium]